MDSDADKTRMIRRSRPSQDQGANPPANQDNAGAPADPDATRVIKPYDAAPQVPPASPVGDEDDATRLINQPGQPLFPNAGSVAGANVSDVDSSDKTQLVRRSSAGKASTSSAAPVSPGISEDDPVTGWLVVIDGPGKGSQVAIGEQDNHVGRGSGSDSPRITIDFGDHGISRSNAFVVRYDPKKRRFKVLPGEGTNIVYLNDEDLDSPCELQAGDVIEVSETKLRFVPFCGGGFDWADTYDA